MMTRRRRPRWQGILCGVLPLLAGIALASAAQAGDVAMDLWQQQRQMFEHQLRGKQSIQKHRIDELLQIRVERKFLVLRTALPNTPDPDAARIKLGGSPNILLAAVQRPPGAASELVEPLSFRLSIIDYSVPKQSTTTSVTADSGPSQVSIARSVIYMDGRSRQIELVQQRGTQSTGGGLLQLRVSEALVPGAAPEQVNLESPDFFTFIREHPRETDRYVRPLLRDVGQESVFAPEPVIAWQVFSELWNPDPAVGQTVQQLLPRLDAEDFHVRNAALERLRQLGRDGAVVLIHLDRKHLSPEQNARINRALGTYTQLSGKEAQRLRSDPAFLLDCLYAEDPSLRQAAFERLRSTVRPDLSFDVNAEPQVRNAAVVVLRRQVLPLSAHPAPYAPQNQ